MMKPNFWIGTTKQFLYKKGREIMKKITTINPNLVMNEKDMAAYLGISRYFLTELRKKHGLKCMIFEGQHCIYYYLPVVDEFFRSRSKGLDTGIPTLSEDTPITDTPGNADKPAENNKAEIGTATPFTTRILPYKPMRIV